MKYEYIFFLVFITIFSISLAEECKGNLSKNNLPALILEIDYLKIPSGKNIIKENASDIVNIKAKTKEAVHPFIYSDNSNINLNFGYQVKTCVSNRAMNEENVKVQEFKKYPLDFQKIKNILLNIDSKVALKINLNPSD